MGSVIGIMGLVAPEHVGISQKRDKTRVPCIGQQILNDWTTKEVSHCDFNLHFPDDEHLLKKLLAIHIPSLERYLPKYFIHSKTGLFV